MPTFTNSETASPNLNVDTFAPTDLDIDQWLDACVAAGMTYACLTTKHHDGFVLWPTTYHVEGFDPYSIAQTTWYANNGNPDIVGLFVTKCREHNLNPCLYFSMWDTTYEARSETDETTDEAGYQAMILHQLTELLTNYGDITAIWTDGWAWHLGYGHTYYPVYRDLVRTLQPNCLLIENCHIHPPTTSDIEVYETQVAGDGAIPNGNTRLSEEVRTVRVDTAWFCDENDSQLDAAFTASATLLAAIANANNNAATFMLGIAPDKSGHLPAALVTRLGQLGA